jgi:hypothetical protein
MTTTEGGSHMKTMAKHWEGQFEDVMRDGPRGQFRQRLEWFLFRLHLAVHTVETQSDGTQLLIFGDGSVYGGESQLDALLALAPGRNSERQHAQTQFGRGDKDQKRCKRRNGYRWGRINRRKPQTIFILGGTNGGL